MARFIQGESRRQKSGGVDPASILMAAGSDQSQKQKNRGGDDTGADDSDEGGQKLAEKGDELKEDMDSLLDEIDAVLEENAEQFVKNYVQRGGE